MKFSARQDVNLPIETAFAYVVEAEQYEMAALRRGVEISRTPRGPVVSTGETWTAQAILRGRKRDIEAEVLEVTAPTRLRFEVKIKGLVGDSDLELIALSPTKTRLMVAVNVKAKSLSARILLQSAKLAKGRADRRFKEGFREVVRSLETRGKR